MELFANRLPSFTMNLCAYLNSIFVAMWFLFVHFYDIRMWLMDYTDSLRVGYKKNKLKIIYCVSKSFYKTYIRLGSHYCPNPDPLPVAAVTG